MSKWGWTWATLRVRPRVHSIQHQDYVRPGAQVPVCGRCARKLHQDLHQMAARRRAKGAWWPCECPAAPAGGRTDPLWVAELVTHEGQVALAAEAHRDEADHLVQCNAALNCLHHKHKPHQTSHTRAPRTVQWPRRRACLSKRVCHRYSRLMHGQSRGNGALDRLRSSCHTATHIDRLNDIKIPPNAITLWRSTWVPTAPIEIVQQMDAGGDKATNRGMHVKARSTD